MKAAALLQALHRPWSGLPVRAPLPLLLGIGGLVLGGLALWQSSATLDDASARMLRARSQLQRVQTELEAARALETRLQPALARYQTLYASGIVASPRPEQWLDAVRRLHGVQARFGPPRTLEPAGAASPPALQASTLSLELALLHEAELPAVLGTLQAERGARVVTRACRIERLPVRSAHEPQSATLQASCTQDWLTITPPGAR